MLVLGGNYRVTRGFLTFVGSFCGEMIYGRLTGDLDFKVNRLAFKVNDQIISFNCQIESFEMVCKDCLVYQNVE